MLKRRALGLFVIFVLFGSAFLFSPFSIQADTTKLAKIISSDPSVVSLCFANDIQIFETYETFFLAEVKDQQENTLKTLGIQYEIIPDAGKINFGGYEFISKEDKTLSYPENLTLNPPNLSKQLYLIQFIGPIKQEWKDALVVNGIKIGIPVNQFGLIIQSDTKIVEFLRSLRFVKSVGILPDMCKMSTMIDRTKDRVDLDITTMLSFSVSSFQALLNDPVAEYGYTESSANGSLVIVNLSSSLLSKVIENQDLLIINQKGTPQLTNAEASQILNINDLADQNQIAGLKGKGEIIGVADTGLSTGNFATIHPAFTNPTYLDKIAAVFPSSGWGDPHGHGTHVAGSVLGSGLGATVPADGTRYKGMAPEAKLVFQAIFYTSYGNNPIYSIIQDAYNAGARIHSNSWSNSYDWGQYDTYTRFFDQYMWDNMDFQLLFAAGNDRQAPQYYPWPPSNNGTQCLTAFSGSKNCIAVGASQNNKPGYSPNRMSVFSSIGPTHDGRIKPDVIAPGNYIRSSWRTGGYGNMNGTSMATPITAGSLALIRENYRKTYHLPPSEIPASLLKATMINGCNTTDVYDHPNYTGGAQLFLSRSNFISGFGRVDIKNSIFPSSNNWMFYNEYASDRSKGLKQGELIKRYYVHVSQANQPLKATLVWTDMPGTACANNPPFDYYDLTPELVNDLDITITKYNPPDPNIFTGTTEQYVGNRFNPNGYSTNMIGSGILNPYDVLNNVEVVNIQNPSVGIYEIGISAFRSGIQSDLAHGFRQPFSLVVSGPAISSIFPPSVPMALTGKTTCSSNELSWTEGQSGVTPVKFFRITRTTITGPGSGSIVTYQVPATVRSYSDSNITIGTEYFYYVQAISDKGMVSDHSTGIQLGLIIPPGSTGFYPPMIRPTFVALHWSTPKPGTCPVQGYYVYRSNTLGQVGSVFSALIPKNEPMFTDTTVEQGETWYYSVVAVDSHGFQGNHSMQLKVVIPMDQTETVLSVESSKRELCQGDAVTFKLVIFNKSVNPTDALKLIFYPSSDFAFNGTDRLTGVRMPSGAIEFLIGKLPAKSSFTFSLFCNQSRSVQQERSTKLIFTLSNPKEILNQEELTLLLKKCGGGNTQGSLEISAKVLNLITDPTTGERYLPFDEELKLFLDLSGGVGPYQLKINWGDGKSDSQKLNNLEPLTITHKYDSKGVMNISIELSDSSGNTKKISFTIKVK